MLDALYRFFVDLFYISDLEYLLDDYEIPLYGDPNFSISTNHYMALICSYISLIFIVVLCCLFVYKIVRLIGGLIR